MIELTNYASHDIVIDGITIPSYGKATFTSVKNLATMTKWINNHKLSIHYVSNNTPTIKTVKEVVNTKFVKEPIIIESNVDAEVTNVNEENMETKTPTKRGRKSKETNAEADKSDAEKGDMTNATD